MLSPFIIDTDVNPKNLYLDRFPVAQVNRSLQAWDAADEYLINHIQAEGLLNNPLKIAIFNDNFGALCLNCTNHQVTCINDSLLSEQGIAHNLAQNHLDESNITQLTSLDKLPENIDLILFKIPKSKALLTEQLIKIKESYQQDVIFIAADRAKEIHSSTLKIFEKYLGSTKTSLAVKKARLVFSQLDNNQHHSSPFPTQWDLPATYPLEQSFIISNHANVYARDKLDLGARYLIPNLPNVVEHSQVIDLGCGNGVLGLTMLAAQPLANITFVDESYMAIASAQTNIKHNLPNSLNQCQFKVNDCLTDFAPQSVDIVVCNPPFHQQTATTDHIAWQMFKDSFRVLKKGGELRIIGNRQLAYHIKLKRIFGNCNQIDSNKKFVVLSAKKL